jgi:ATP-dependent Lon protease
VTLDGYTETEKVAIARDHLLPRQLERAGLTASDVAVDEAVLTRVATEYTREAGVRQLERALAKILRKAAVQLDTAQHNSAQHNSAQHDAAYLDSAQHDAVQLNGGSQAIHVDTANLVRYLGRPKFTPESAERTAVPGVATGLAVTGTGGDVLFIEATAMDGEPGLTLTGQLGDVMKESAHIALSYLRSHAADLGIDPALLANRRLHLHVPAGAVPKDGPSAGITMATALASLVSGRTVRPDIGMTGELTLSGRVLPIGGVKQKLLAAHRAGLTEVIIPARNEPDLDDVPEEVRAGLKIHPLTDVADVIRLALGPADDASATIPAAA